jgi:hypothetical protein
VIGNGNSRRSKSRGMGNLGMGQAGLCVEWSVETAGAAALAVTVSALEIMHGTNLSEAARALPAPSGIGS